MVQAKEAIKRKNYIEAKTVLESLLSKHPEAEQALEAKASLVKVNSEILRKTRAEQLEKERREQDRQAELRNILQSVRESYDEIEDVRWFHDGSLEEIYSNVYAYIGIKGKEKSYLRYVVRFSFEDICIHFKTYLIVVDGVRHENINRTFNLSDREFYSGSRHCVSDEVASDPDIELLRSIANSKKTVLRFQERGYSGSRNIDRTVSDSDKRALHNMLVAFEELNIRNAD